MLSLTCRAIQGQGFLAPLPEAGALFWRMPGHGQALRAAMAAPKESIQDAAVRARLAFSLIAGTRPKIHTPIPFAVLTCRFSAFFTSILILGPSVDRLTNSHIPHIQEKESGVSARTETLGLIILGFQDSLQLARSNRQDAEANHGSRFGEERLFRAQPTRG